MQQPEDLWDALSDAELTDERGVWQRYEFEDGSAIVVRSAEDGKREEYHVGLERADCANDQLLTALATALGKRSARREKPQNSRTRWTSRGTTRKSNWLNRGGPT